MIKINSIIRRLMNPFTSKIDDFIRSKVFELCHWTNFSRNRDTSLLYQVTNIFDILLNTYLIVK